MDDGWLQVTEMSSREKRTAQTIIAKSRLDAGEAESIALASSRRLMVILDDKEARSFAEAMGIEFQGTAGMFLQAFFKKLLTFTELEDAVQELSKTTWLAPMVVAQILRVAREAKR